jgi:hypothetical protein
MKKFQNKISYESSHIKEAGHGNALCDPNTKVAEARGSQVRGQPGVT